MKKIITVILVIALMLFPINTYLAIVPGEDTVSALNIVIVDAQVLQEQVVSKDWLPSWGRAETILSEDGSEVLLGKAPISDLSATEFPSVVMPDAPKLPVSSPNSISLLGSWYQVTPTALMQYRSTVFLLCRTESGAYISGSGFVLGPSTVVTSAHMVCNEDFYGTSLYPESVTVYPAYTGHYTGSGTAPFGSASATSYAFYQDYRTTGNQKYDWAIITLNRNIGDQTGYPNIKKGPNLWQSISAIGYPGYINAGSQVTNYQMYRSDGSVYSFLDTHRFTSTNTNSAEGMSGGPVYISGPYVVGIVHGAQSSPNRNIYMRMNNDAMDLLETFQNRRV